LAVLWFLCGVMFTLSSVVLLLPWLRTIPGCGALPALPWPVGIGAVLAMGVSVGLCLWLRQADLTAVPLAAAATAVSAKTVTTESVPDSWAGITNALRRGTGAMGNPTAAARSGAGTMAAAIASLQARLAKGGGSADDWELLAKSYEFLHRPAEASKARAHQLPPLQADDTGGSTTDAPRTGPSAASGTAVTGEVALASTLQAKAAAGATLFIVAKSADSPGPPVAVFRTTVGRWPVKFELDDSESMLPGRNLSSARRVTVEARISQSGQALAAAGDLQGTTGVIDTTDHKPLAILIDKVIQ
jgi:hypothetical protein